MDIKKNKRDGYDQKIVNSTDSVDTIVSIPTLESSQTVVSVSTLNSQNSSSNKSDVNLIPRISTKQWISVAILCFVNLINYMDRYTMAGILMDIEKSFDITDDKGGLLQTVFVISYMIFAPLFGYFGDRYNRRILIAIGVFLWSLTTLVGSYMETYETFLLFRACVGIGEASYSTIAPTIISDMFVSNVRSQMLALFYFAIPVGSGLGYIVGSETARIYQSWRCGLRVTPIAGLIAVILILFVMEEPARGDVEGVSHMKATSWSSDVKELLKNKSFMLSTAGFTCVAFVTGALAWWGPNFLFLGFKLLPGYQNITKSSVTFTFGIITMLSGLIGVPLGSYLCQMLRSRYPNIDPIVCGAGLLISAPLLFMASILSNTNVIICYILIFIGEVCMNLNWAIVADILLYVVAPTRRSTAEALQILISHAFGDACSPYIVGLVSEFFKKVLKDTDSSPVVLFKSLQYSLFSTSFIEVIGALFFFLTAIYVVRDKRKVEEQIRGEINPAVASSDFYTDIPDSQMSN